MGIPAKEIMDAHEGRHRESLVYEVEVLRARVKQLGEALMMARHDRDAALDALHALAEWVDAVKADIEGKRQFFGRDPGLSEEEGYYYKGAENAAAICGWLFEGGWDATAGEE